MLIDRGTFDNPKTYVDRNAYFFAPQEYNEVYASQTYSDEISTQDLIASVSQFMGTPSVQAALTTNSDQHDDSLAELWQRISDKSNKANHVLNAICSERAAKASEESSNQTTKTKLYKEWIRSIHAYIRQHVTYGVPCPNTGLVMAVLGYDECCRRLGV